MSGSQVSKDSQGWSPGAVQVAPGAFTGSTMPPIALGAVPSSAPDPGVARDREAAADQLFASGQYAEAVSQYAQIIQLRSEAAGLHFKLACAAWADEQWDLAEQHFLAATQSEPGRAAAHDRLAQLYIDLDRIAPALEHSATARQLDPKNDIFTLTHASALERSGNWQRAWELLEPLLAKRQPDVAAGILYARLAPRLGQQQQAMSLVKRLLGRDEVSAHDRSLLAFAGSKLLDLMGQFDQAFEYARFGNGLVSRAHDPAITEARIERQIRHCTPGQLRALPHATHGSRRPMFIVGMPRSGTSLVEQILAAHPQVHGGGELPDIPRMVGAVSRRASYPECLDTYSLNTFNRLARQYLDGLHRLNPDATYVTDKLPLNCLYLDLIQLLFPGCHVIHCVRDPLDTCVSSYMTDFATGNGFTSDLAKLGSFYRQYERLMKHWRVALDLPILDVQYEGLVQDSEGQARRILDFLGLPWDDRCLHFYENKRPVATASRDQVNQPIYQSSVGRWKKYERHLGELLAGLGG